MALGQQKFREVVFLTLYSYDLGKGTDEDVTPLLMQELAVTRKSVKEAQDRVNDVRKKLPEIDGLIEKISHSYEFSRIQSVEINVIRLGVYEIMHDSEVPPKVAISEAMRLTRKFATPSATAFVNAVLDKIYHMSQGETVDDSDLSKSAAALAESEEIARQIGEDSATLVHESEPTFPSP